MGADSEVSMLRLERSINAFTADAEHRGPEMALLSQTKRMQPASLSGMLDIADSKTATAHDKWQKLAGVLLGAEYNPVETCRD